MTFFTRFRKFFLPSFVLGFLVFLFLSFYGDFQKISRLFLNFNLKILFLLFLLTLGNYLLRFVRWHFFLKWTYREKINLGDSLLIFLSGLALTITPGKIGEISKIYFLSRIKKVSLSRGLPIVAVERLTDGLGMMILMTGGLFLHRYGLPAIIFVFLLSLGIIFLLQEKKLCRTILRKIESVGFLSGINHHLTGIYQSSFLLTSPKILLPAIFLAFFSWSLEAVGLFLILTNLGADFNFVNLLNSFFIFSFSAFLGFAALIPGGLGVNEGSTVGLTGLFLGFDKTRAVASALLSRLTTLWFGVFLGLLALFFLRKKLKNMLK